MNPNTFFFYCIWVEEALGADGPTRVPKCVWPWLWAPGFRAGPASGFMALGALKCGLHVLCLPPESSMEDISWFLVLESLVKNILLSLSSDVDSFSFFFPWTTTNKQMSKHEVKTIWKAKRNKIQRSEEDVGDILKKALRSEFQPLYSLTPAHWPIQWLLS